MRRFTRSEMNMTNFLHHCRRHAVAILASGMALAAPTISAAPLTPSGTDISNNAQVQYQVGGISQTTQSNTATFKVDTLVRVVVSEANTLATPVIPGATSQVVAFTVTNTGNATQDYALGTANLPNGTALSLGSNNYNDAFDSQGACSIRVESGTAPNAGVYDPTDTATSIVNLAPDQSRTVYVICDIPPASATVVNGADAVVSLTATTADAGSCVLSCTPTAQDAGADNPLTVQVVFGDVNGTDDGARDGKHSARDAFEVSTASLSITKTVTPICDPFNFNSNPKNVPGAYVQYAITISNATGSGQSATLTTISDELPASLSFDPDLRTGAADKCAESDPASALGSGFKLTCTTFVGNGTPRTCTAPAGVFYTGAADTDAVTVSTCSGKPCVSITAGDSIGGIRVLGTETGYGPGELKSGESITIRFNAIIK